MIIERPETEEEVEEKPKKKKHFGWLIALIIFLAIPITLVGLAYGFLYDNTPADFNYDESFNKEKVIDKLYADPFDNTKDTAIIHYDVELNDINNIIYETLRDTLNSTIFGAIGGAYITCDSDSYTLTLKTAGNPIFETKANLNLSLSRTRLEDDDYEYAFSINKMYIGRLELLDNMVSDYAARFIEDEKIEQAFKKVGFDITSDIANRKISARETNLIENVKELIKDRSDLFYLRMIETFLNLKLIELYHDNDSLLNMDIDLSRLGESIYHDSTKAKNLDIMALTGKMKTLLNNNVITLDDTSNLLSYLINGYDESDDEIKAKVETLDLSSINIDNALAYQGVRVKENIDLSEYTQDQMDLPTIMATGEVANIDENIFTSVFRDKSIIGHTYEFKRVDDYHYNVMMIDDIYVNILNDKLIINLSLNVNGYVTELVVELEKVESTSPYKLELDVKSVNFGNKDVVTGFKDEILKIMSGNLTFDMFTVTEDGKIILDLESMLDDVTKAAIDARGGLDINLIGDELTSIGKLDIRTKN